MRLMKYKAHFLLKFYHTDGESGFSKIPWTSTIIISYGLKQVILYLRPISFTADQYLLTAKTWFWNGYVSSKHTRIHTHTVMHTTNRRTRRDTHTYPDTHTHTEVHIHTHTCTCVPTPQPHYCCYHPPSNKPVRTLATNLRRLVSSMRPGGATPSQIPPRCGPMFALH